MHYPFWKRCFDITFASLALLLFLPLMLLLYIASSIDVSSSGLFMQNRVGQFGKNFVVYKFQSIHPKTRKISWYGKVLRRFKLDELPQLFNIVKEDMSFVGPRPDVEGYYDQLKGEDRQVLQLKPGLTSEASVKYRNEEKLLLQQDHPQQYNDEILFPDKVQLNLEYMKNMSLKNDLKIIFRTIITIFE